MENPITAALAIGGAILTGIFGFALKGQIRGSDAEQLWRAAEKMRKELRDEIEVLRTEHRSCTSEIDTLRRAVVQLQADRDTLSRQVEKLERENLSLRQDNARLKAALAELGQKVANGNGGAK